MIVRRARAAATATRTLPADPAAVFPLLCPQREYEWIDTWACELLHSESGFAELDCIFTTDLMRAFGIGRETWVCAVYEPPHRIAFVRTSEHLTIRLEIALQAAGEGRTTARAQTVASALDGEGEAIMARLAPALEPMYDRVLAKLDHYLASGTMLRDGVTADSFLRPA